KGKRQDIRLLFQMLFIDAECPQTIVIDGGKKDLLAVAKSDKRHILYIAFQNEPALRGRHGGECFLTIAAQEASKGRVISSGDDIGLVVISRQQQILISVMVDIRAHDSVYRSKLRFHRQDMLNEFSFPQVFKPTTPRLITIGIQHVRLFLPGKQFAKPRLRIVLVEQKPLFYGWYLGSELTSAVSRIGAPDAVGIPD